MKKITRGKSHEKEITIGGRITRRKLTRENYKGKIHERKLQGEKIT